jgi:hypothetical protein
VEMVSKKGHQHKALLTKEKEVKAEKDRSEEILQIQEHEDLVVCRFCRRDRL